MKLFATAALGTADLLAAELAALGATAVDETRGGVAFEGTLATAYRACLWSRVAMRVLLPVASFPAADAAALYAGARTVPWHEHLGPDDTLAVDASAQRSTLTHTQFIALKLKDAVVDGLRERYGSRPSVDTSDPSVRINLHLDRDVATISIDLAGESLHRRGYRDRSVAAPLKETLAAAILLRAGWPAIAGTGGAFVDPMCGSGTLPIEAALIATDRAPGLLRTRFGFERWRQHDAVAWRVLTTEAAERAAAGRWPGGRIYGYDRDAAAIRTALGNVDRAGLHGIVHCERRELTDLGAAPAARGLLAVNPPYGERIGAADELKTLYSTLGEQLAANFLGWEAAVFTGNPPLGRELKLKARRTHRMYNGALECRLLRITIEPGAIERPREPGRVPPFDVAAARARPGSQMFGNRLAKNVAHLRSWVKRERVACYRLYDADMPEYAFAIDLYQATPDATDERWLYVQEYAAPDSVDPARAKSRREEAFAALPEVTGVPMDRIHRRVRQPQKGTRQYEKLADSGAFHVVEEGGLKFEVNFTDYLDTGLFLDHRSVRLKLGSLARGKRFLNLFAYTGSATVHAVAGGALSSLTLDLSNTYLDWAVRNLGLNGLRGQQHRFEREDCVAWLAAPPTEQFDLVFLDPPTFSNSKRMEGVLDTQRDHVALLNGALARLAPGGLIVFSTNYRRFALDRDALAGLVIEDWTRATLPKDFERSQGIHQVYALRRSD